MIRRTALLATLAIATPAAAESEVTPYIEVQQVLDACLKGCGAGGDDILTYTSIAAGVDASVRTRRAQGTISYRYERRIPWNDSLGVEDVHTGLARGQIAVVPGLLTFEGGAIATRARTDIRGAAPEFLIGDQSNTSQVYGLYAGPTLATEVGALDFTASYRFGYVKVQEDTGVFIAPGRPRLDLFDEATTHQLDASIAMPTGRGLPFGWSVSTGYQREDASQLDQRYEARYVRADATLPVSDTVALTGGVGHEDIEISERAPLRDPVTGFPVIDGNGRFVTDRASPRLLAYETDGLIWDVGVIWRPSRRTSLTARYGRRYGGEWFTATLEHQIGAHSGVQIFAYSALDSFGRGLTSGVARLPTDFVLPGNPIGGGLGGGGGGCVGGPNPATGGCLDDAFQSISTANYRSRGVYARYSAKYGPWDFGVSAGYANRDYIAPGSVFFTIDGVTDESVSIQANAARDLGPNAGIDAAIYANLYESGIAGGGDVTSYGAALGYHRFFGRRLSGNAAVGLYAYDPGDFATVISAVAQLGMRYQF